MIPCLFSVTCAWRERSAGKADVEINVMGGARSVHAPECDEGWDSSGKGRASGQRARVRGCVFELTLPLHALVLQAHRCSPPESAVPAL